VDDAAIVILVPLAAVPEFGALFTVGHLPLLVIPLHGPTPLQWAAYPRRAHRHHSGLDAWPMRPGIRLDHGDVLRAAPDRRPGLSQASASPGLDLLRNVKWAIDHDAMLRIDFFTSENMKRFFGVSAAVFREIAAGGG
jgi:hypothetical protein